LRSTSLELELELPRLRRSLEPLEPGIGAGENQAR
jgi:hypothetical protein